MNAESITPDKLDESLIVIKDKLNWTARNAVEGVQIFGGIGSGKTSGSGRTLALKYLAAGYGGLVLTVKPTELDEWHRYCQLTGREADLLVVEPGGNHSFNFLDYESKVSGEGNALTENIVQVLKTVIRAGEEKAHGKADDPFWENALDMLMFNVIDLCKLGHDGKVSVDRLYEIVQSLPKQGSNTHQLFLEAYGLAGNDPEKNNPVKDKPKLTAYQVTYLNAYQEVKRRHSEWWDTLTTEHMRSLVDNDTLYNQELSKAIPEARLLKYIDNFIEGYTELNDRTRSIIDFSFSGFLFRLLREPIYSLFCSRPSTFQPEDCINGKIILINLPVKLYHKVGRDCQILIKYIFQRAMEKRPISNDSRPVFLWADEAQNFLHEHDPDFLATARSSRIATVYISQNLPNYKANMGGEHSEHKVKSFLGTLATKIFHANADVETNKYASELIGDRWRSDVSTTAGGGERMSFSRTESTKIDRFIRPEEFTRLKTGSANNKFETEAIIHFQGAILKTDENHIKVPFNQLFTPKSKLS